MAAWLRGWRERFGLAEAVDWVVALAAFGWGLATWHHYLPAAGLAAVTSAVAFYAVLVVKTAARALAATGHLTGWRRWPAALWHAFHDQVISCALAETLYLIAAPVVTALGAWALRSLPGGVWVGFTLSKIATDSAWYAIEDRARAAMAALLALVTRWRDQPPAQPIGVTTDAQQFIHTGRWGT